MSLVLYSRHFDYAEGLCAYTALKAGGLTPIMGNFEHCTIAIMQIEAFGGLQIFLPEEEVDQADAWIKFIYANPIQDYDPIKRRRFGKWKRGTIMGMCSFIFLPIFFISPKILALMWGVFFIWDALTKELSLGTYYTLALILLLLHAKYVAGLKFIKEENANVA